MFNPGCEAETCMRYWVGGGVETLPMKIGVLYNYIE